MIIFFVFTYNFSQEILIRKKKAIVIRKENYRTASNPFPIASNAYFTDLYIYSIENLRTKRNSGTEKKYLLKTIIRGVINYILLYCAIIREYIVSRAQTALSRAIKIIDCCCNKVTNYKL